MTSDPHNSDPHNSDPHNPETVAQPTDSSQVPHEGDTLAPTHDAVEAFTQVPAEPVEARLASKSLNSNAFETYNTIAETVGMVPSLRMKDNIIQAIVIGIGTFLGVIIGGMLQGITGAIVSAMLGLILSLLLSGMILMVVGWVRAIQKIR